MLKRNIEPALLEAIQDTPVLLINGARQTGKSTLVQTLFKATHQYLTLDDPTVLASIKGDPLLFLADLKSPTILDEVQRAPELFLPLKKVIDENRRPGFFVLTGSANILTLPRLSESLAGRMEIHTLWPFSQGEILGRKETFIDNLFNNDFKPFSGSLSLEDLAARIVKGGYPVPIGRENSNRRGAWFKGYLTTLLEKDIQSLSHIEGLAEIPNLLSALASRVGGLLNTTDISRTLHLPNTTLKRYLRLLQMIFIVNYLPAWSKNFTKKLIKSPKIYLNDTGLLMDILFCNEERLLSQKTFFGSVLENFVVMEIFKQQTWCRTPFKSYHYRKDTGQEVDMLLEAADGRIVGIEIKLAQSVDANDFKGIGFLEKLVEEKFHRGVVLYLGSQTLPFDDNKYALPLRSLWEL